MTIHSRLAGSVDYICLPLTVALMLGALISLLKPAEHQPRGVVTVYALSVNDAGTLISAAPVSATNPG